MDKVYEELDEVKAELEKLRAEKKDKDSIIQHLTAANGKLRVSSEEKYQKLKDTNRELALALEEANEKNIDQEQAIGAYKEEIEGLQWRLSVSKKKCAEAEEKANALTELRERDEVIHKLEEEDRKVQDELKWKKEQFRHLEEAHEKVRDQFKASKKEWEMERSVLIGEMCSLQTSLDSQTRISDDLQKRLQMCNQALAHEESRRKKLELQVSEFQTRFENVFSNCEEANSQLECLTSQRDKEIASLRQSLSTKETLYKEMEYQTGKLQQENKELQISLKEFQEAQIQAAPGSPSLAKLRNKLKSLEHVHRDCVANHRTKAAEWSSQLEKMRGELKIYRSESESKDAAIKELRMELEQMHRGDTTNWAKDAEWSCQLEKMTGDVKNYMSELESKDATIKELKMELEACHSLNMQLKLQNEELSVMLLVLKQRISEVQLKIANEKSEMDMHDKEKQDNISLLMQQLEMKNAALISALTGIEEEREKAASLSMRIDSFDLVEKQKLQMQKELDMYKEMLEQDSSKNELCLKPQVLQMESVLKGEVREVNDALERANTELAEKNCEGDEIEFELQIWTLIIERLRIDLEESLRMRKELEASLLAEVDFGETIKQEKKGLLCILEEKDITIDNLQQQILLLQNSEQDKNLEQLQKEIGWLEQESLRREFTCVVMAQTQAERAFEHEKEKLIRRVEEKYQRVNDVMQLVESLEQKFNSSLVSFSSQLAEKEAEINLIHKAWEKITAAPEIDEKKLRTVELEGEICNIQQKLESQQKSLCASKQQALDVEAELEEKEMEAKKLTNQTKTKLRNSDALIEDLKSERRNLLEDVNKLSSEKENLLRLIGGMGDKISEFSSTDKQLMGMLERIMISFNNKGSGIELKLNDELDTEQENVSTTTLMRKSEAISDIRSPFRDLNT